MASSASSLVSRVLALMGVECFSAGSAEVGVGVVASQNSPFSGVKAEFFGVFMLYFSEFWGNFPLRPVQFGHTLSVVGWKRRGEGQKFSIIPNF